MKNKNQESPLMNPSNPCGVLLINKPKGVTSFRLVSALRKICNVQKVGHSGTLDPFASGVMILLVGKQYTKLSDRFLLQNKEYLATLHLGIRTDSYDCEGNVISESSYVPSMEEISSTLQKFQGTILQTPPMFSAKKIGGKKLYELARKGIEIERAACEVSVSIQLLAYDYPFLKIQVQCSKGTYIRSLAEDIGIALGSGAHLSELTRTRSGSFSLEECCDGQSILSHPKDLPISLPFLGLDKIESRINTV